ncbi:MAG: PorP/SprF family type IX secretion system membrane protein [Saprospiraceae bacterium]|nr:PorP/SprF family type IX secretion system membrane protein [Saprospiraceae bacterium]
MKRLILALILIVSGTALAVGQTEGVYRHYLLSPTFINPAYSGFQDEHELIVNYNNTWAAFPGSPKLVTAAWNGPVGERIGLGAQLSSESIASLQSTKAQLSYAFKFLLNDVDLSLGLATSYEQIRLKGEALLDPFFESDDLAIVDAVGGLKVFDAALGVHGQAQDVYFGLNLPNLIRARVDTDPNIDTEAETSFFEHFLAYVGYRWQVQDYNFHLEPSLVVKNLRNSPFQVDFNMKANFFEDQLVGGLTYTLGGGNRISVLLGTELTKLNIYYSYTTSFAQFQQYNNGGHEISVGFNFGKRKSTLEDTDG